MRRSIALSLAVFAWSCSSAHAGGVTVDVTGPQGEPIAATHSTDILIVDVSVDGVRGNAVVDTGSPIVALDPSAFAGATLPDGAGTVGSLALGPLAISHPPVVGANLITSPDPTVPIDGSLGCGILCAFVVSLDYRGATVTLGASAPPANVAQPGGSVAFSLQGGGTSSISGVPGSVDFPASRIVVSTTVEGHAYSFVVDTGSSLVLLRQSIFNALVADGRAQIGGLTTATVGASSTSSVTRVRSLSVAGQEVDGLVASSDPSLESGLDSVATEIGGEVDGLVAGSFLRQFYVTVDYPGGALELRRYTEGGPTYDLFDRVGVDVAPASGANPARVTTVYAGTSAAALGVSVGDAIVAIDGEPLAGLGSTAVDVAVSGPVGSTKTVEFGAASSASLSMKSVSIGVDDILPL